MKVKIFHATDKKQKHKLVREKYNDRVPSEEIDTSEVWAITDESGKGQGLIMLTREDAWKQKSDHCARLSHMAVDYNQEITLEMYCHVEQYCIESNIDSLSISVPKDLKDVKNFLKRLGYKKLALLEVGANFPDGNTECWGINNIKEFWEEGKGRKIKQ